MFAFKGVVKKNPQICLLTSLFVTTVVFGFQLRIFEGPLSDISGQDFNSMFSCMWNVIITMSSVGYGELYPKTSLGRIIGVIICFWGVFITSAMVVIILDFLEYDIRECRAFILLMNVFHKDNLKLNAVEVIKAAYLCKNDSSLQRDFRKKII